MSSIAPSVDEPVIKTWEFTSFDGDPLSPKEAVINLPTIEQIAAIEEQARHEGYQSGRAEGHAEGYAQGYAQGQEKSTFETERLRRIADIFATEVRTADETISQSVLDLSLDFARAILKTGLTVRPELVIPIVKEAVRYLPSLQQPAMLYLNPDDAALVNEVMGVELAKMGWQIANDAQIEPGGCRVETASNQIDATLPTRWQRIAAALGIDSDWLMP